MGEMTKELAIIPKGFAALTAVETGALSEVFRQARRDCRDAAWPMTDARPSYLAALGEFMRNDPLFGKDNYERPPLLRRYRDWRAARMM